MSQPIIGQGGHFVFPIHLKNTNLVEGVAILLPIKFRRIPFTVSEENRKCLSQSEAILFFPDLPEEHKHGRRHWELASCQVSLNSVQRFQRRSRKRSRPIRGQGCHLVFLIGTKNTNLVEGVKILIPVKFRWIPFSGFSEEVENISANQRPGGHLVFPIGPKNTKFGRGRWDLASCQNSLNSVQRFLQRSRKCLSQSEDGGGHFIFPIGPKNTNLVEGVEILLSVKFRWIPFSGFRGEVENVKVYAGRTMRFDNSSLEPSAQVS